MKKIYLASPLSLEKRKDMYEAIEILREEGFDVYAPVEHKIDNAWAFGLSIAAIVISIIALLMQ